MTERPKNGHLRPGPAHRAAHPAPDPARARRGRSWPACRWATYTDHYVKLRLPAAPGSSYPQPLDLAADPPRPAPRAVAPAARVHGAGLGPAGRRADRRRGAPRRRGAGRPVGRRAAPRRRGALHRPRRRVRPGPGRGLAPAGRRRERPAGDRRRPGAAAAGAPAHGLRRGRRPGRRAAAGQPRRGRADLAAPGRPRRSARRWSRRYGRWSSRPAPCTPSCTARPASSRTCAGCCAVERGVPSSQLSISGYWRRGMDDEGWRSTKADWNRQVEAEEAAGRPPDRHAPRTANRQSRGAATARSTVARPPG